MSNEQKYNEQWDDLPLPDREAAWQKMSKLLDDEERRRAVPVWFWRLAVVLLALICVGAGWWLLAGSNNEKEPRSIAAKTETGVRSEETAKTESKAKAEVSPKEKPLESKTTRSSSSTIETKASAKAPVVSSAEKKVTSVDASSPPAAKQNAVPSVKSSFIKKQNVIASNMGSESQHRVAQSSLPLRKAVIISNNIFTRKRFDKGNAVAEKKRLKATTYQDAATGKNTRSTGLVATLPSTQNVAPAETKKAQPATPDVDAKKVDSTVANKIAKADSINKKDTSVALPLPPVVQKKDAKKKEALKIVWSAGVGMQQPIALQRQLAQPTDSMGRKSGFFDYFPSVYVKAEKGKWALQAEFQYSAPQPTASFPFSQKTTYYLSNGVTETERYYLRKLYYHQLPISINYQLLPQLSVGVGGVYNIFAGAVLEHEIISTETVSRQAVDIHDGRETIKGYDGSFFYKTTASLLLQSDYHWKRFSLGLRYMQNLQPFIKYTEPNGTVTDKKNNALQAVLRFQLWKSEP